MKIPYSQLLKFIPSAPSITEVSEKLFQLGHEHEINDGIFDMEFTPNRGDCLSLNGLLRDLMVFYDINQNNPIYSKQIDKFEFDFINEEHSACPNISFLKINIDNNIKEYSGALKEYFDDLHIKKNNFFTDISNFILYETGQPTHCYDATKIDSSLQLKFIEGDYFFETLLDKEIRLTDKNLAFISKNKVINLAGIMGGKSSSCSNDTRSVLIECAYFNPEDIIGKAVKYALTSDAAHKFERGVDPLCQEKVLRRFIKIIEEHADILSINLCQFKYKNFENVRFKSDFKKVNDILGIKISKEEYQDYISRLGFHFEDDYIVCPSYRSDIKNMNDIAEEIARVIGYNNIRSKSLTIPSIFSTLNSSMSVENKLKDTLISNGFYEVINNPFVKDIDLAIKVDNPLDSNREYLRTDLKNSLLNNLLYNERRQKLSVKLFEFSDIYSLSEGKIQKKRSLGIICSGIVGKNYLDFSKKIDTNYLYKVLDDVLPKNGNEVITINRKDVQTKKQDEIVYLEIEINQTTNSERLEIKKHQENRNIFKKYTPISEFPSSSRDLSFSIDDPSKYYDLQKFVLNFKSELLKEVFVFDFYKDEKNEVIKLGFRFIFQSSISTVTEDQVNEVMNNIISHCLAIDSVKIPGLENLKH